MSVVTTPKIVEPQITASRDPEMETHHIRNYRLSTVIQQFSRLMLFLVKCDSANTLSKNTPRDTRAIRAQWEIARAQLDFAFKNNDRPEGPFEFAYECNLLTPVEIQKVKNQKIKMVVQELYHSVHVMINVDSANSQAYIDPADQKDIQSLFDTAESYMDMWIGTGETDDNLGLDVPAYERVGYVTPDIDNDAAERLEPGPDFPRPSLPDAKWQGKTES